MDIFKKIEQIREKPEHIRMRYVWGLVSFFIVIIIFIWIFSLKNTFENLGKKDINIDKLNIMNNIKENKNPQPQPETGSGANSPFANDFNNSLNDTGINQ